MGGHRWGHRIGGVGDTGVFQQLCSIPPCSSMHQFAYTSGISLSPPYRLHLVLFPLQLEGRLTALRVEAMARGAIEKAASDSVAALFLNVSSRLSGCTLEIGMPAPCKADENDLTFTKIIHENFADDMRLRCAEGPPPYTYVDVHFSNCCIRVTVNEASTKNTAKEQLSRRCPMDAIARLYAAWKEKYWFCKKHAPGDNDACPYCLQYRGEL